MYADFTAENAFSSFLDQLAGVLELISIALIWLVFFPPRLYRRWLSGREADDRAVEER